jgi:hypothetical protein
MGRNLMVGLFQMNNCQRPLQSNFAGRILSKP